LEHHIYHFVGINEWKKKIFINSILVPSLAFAQLDEYERKILSSDSNRITLDAYLRAKKQCLRHIGGHPVRDLPMNVFHMNFIL
jgi:hypothetical protein